MGQRGNPRLERISHDTRAGCVQFLRLYQAHFSYREYLRCPRGVTKGELTLWP